MFNFSDKSFFEEFFKLEMDYQTTYYHNFENTSKKSFRYTSFFQKQMIFMILAFIKSFGKIRF